VDIPGEIAGAFGIARRAPQAHLAARPDTKDAWLIDGDYWHPLWGQYVLAVSTLEEIPGARPVVLHVEGATHEISVLALNPDHPTTIERLLIGPIHFLEPASVCEQFICPSDEIAVELGFLCARAVCFGQLNPEPEANTERKAWRFSIAQTLNHFKDPTHGSGN
jgi:hypothetical protein